MSSSSSSSNSSSSNSTGSMTSIFASLTPFNRLYLALAMALILAMHGWRKRSLSLSGALAACACGGTIMFTGFRFGTVLIVFYYTGSRLTKMHAEKKRRLESDYDVGSRRTATQVISNAGIAMCACVCYMWMLNAIPRIAPIVANVSSSSSSSSSWHSVFDFVHEWLGTEDWSWRHWLQGDIIAADCDRQPIVTSILCAYVAAVACACGDTYASELGVLSSRPPRLITTFRRVPAGTNGGVTVLGFIVSLCGGIVVGAAFFLSSVMMGLGGIRGGSMSSSSSSTSTSIAHMTPSQAQFIWIGGIAGLLGSVIDSFLGATMQFSGWHEQRHVVVGPPSSTSTSTSSSDNSDDNNNEKKGDDRNSMDFVNIKHIAGRDVLDNHQVNLLSTLLTAVIVGRYAPEYFFTHE